MKATDGVGNGEFDPEEFLDLPMLKVMDLGTMLSRSLEAKLGDRAVSLTEARILSVLAAHPGCTAVDVSGIIPIDAPTVSRAVHSLAQNGLLSRRRSRADRRTVRLRATDEGLALLRECQPLLAQASADFLGSLDEDQRHSLRSAVEVLLDADS